MNQIEKDASICFSNNVQIFLEGNLKNRRVQCSAQYCFIPFFQRFLCGLCEDATPVGLLYIIGATAQSHQRQTLFLSTKKTIKSGVPEAQRFKTHAMQP